MKWALGVLAAILALAIAAVVVVPYVVDTHRVQGLIAGSVSQLIGRPVRFSAISVRPLPWPSVDFKGLEVDDDPRFGSGPFLTLERGTLRLSLLPLLTGHVDVAQVILNKPSITLIQDVHGRWNIGSLGAAPEGRPTPPRSGRSGTGGGPGGGGGLGAAGVVLGSKMKIEKGLVTYATRGGARAARYRVEDLDLTVKGAGTQVAVEGALRVTPGDLDVRIARGTLSVPANARAPLLEAPVQARMTLDGKDVTELVATIVGPAPAVTGPVKGTLDVAGTLGAPRVAGEVELPSVKVTARRPTCPEPRQRSLALSGVKLDVRWEGDRILVRPAVTALGRGTISTNVTVTPGGRRVELADVTIKAVPLEAVLVDFLCESYAVTGPLDLTGTFAFQARDIWRTLSGEGRFSVGHGKVVGSHALAILGSVARVGGAMSSVIVGDVPVSGAGSPLEFDAITATYQITDGVVTTRDLRYSSRSMKVGVSGQYTLASGALNLDVVVNQQGGQLAARVTGTAAAPSIRVLPSTIVREVDPQGVQRGLEDLLKLFR